MKIVRTIDEVRREVAAARADARPTTPAAGAKRPRAGKARAAPPNTTTTPTTKRHAVALTPTMGYLHEGHLSLMDRARERAAVSVVSVFVNPLQFGPGEDFEAYPRDESRDADVAEGRGVDILFMPPAEEVYPDGELEVRIVPGGLAERLCGLARPTHFAGVLTVVAKLFGIVQPDLAVFGQKDFQQVTLIRRMVRDLNMPLEIEMAPIVREEDGLALSSRNTYLTEHQRERALSLSRGLFAARETFDEGVRDAERLKARVRGIMRGADVEPEYIELVDPDALDPLDEARAGAVLAVAARVGETRLIDNLILGSDG